MKKEVAQGLFLVFSQPLARRNGSIDMPFVKVQILVHHQPMIGWNVFASAMIVESQDRQGVRIRSITEGTNRLGCVVEDKPFVSTAFVFARLKEVDGFHQSGVPGSSTWSFSGIMQSFNECFVEEFL